MLAVLAVLFIACEENDVQSEHEAGVVEQAMTSGCVRYVSPDAEEGGDGLSWKTAFTTTDEALGSLSRSGVQESACEIWIAGDNAALPENVPEGVKVYSGFKGNETSRVSAAGREVAVARADREPESGSTAWSNPVGRGEVTTAPLVQSQVTPLVDTDLWGVFSSFWVMPTDFRGVAISSFENDGTGAALEVGTHDGSCDHIMLVDGNEIDMTGTSTGSCGTPALFLNHNSGKNVYICDQHGGTCRVGIGVGTSVGSSLEVYGEAIASGSTGNGTLRVRDSSSAIVMDGNQIETTGSTLYVNHRNNAALSLAYGGGNVAIGATSTTAHLEVNGAGTTNAEIRCKGDGGENAVVSFYDSSVSRGMIGWDDSLSLFKMVTGSFTSNNGITIDGSGHVGIGTSDPDQGTEGMLLSVNGPMKAESIKVDAVTADFVFDDGYSLPDLDDVRAFTKEHGHLPDVPSAEEMERNGIGVADLSGRLLQKIEELTLYAIRQDERIQALEQKLSSFEQER